MMAQFTREIGESTFAPSVTQPIERSDDAAAIQAIGGIAQQLYGGAQRARGKELAQQFKAEAVTTSLAPETGAKLTAGDVIGAAPEAKLAEAEARQKGKQLEGAKKAGLRPGHFKVRAESSLKELMAAHPLFSEEIKRGFIAETGFDPTGSTIAEAFARMDSQAKAASGQDDYWVKMADKHNVIRDPAVNPNWKRDTQVAVQKQNHIDNYEFVKAQGEATVETEKLSMSVEMSPEVITNLVATELGMSEELLADPALFAAAMSGKTEQDLDLMKKQIESSWTRYRTGKARQYTMFANTDPEGFEGMLKVAKSQVDLVLNNLDNKNLYQIIQAEQKAMDATNYMEVLNNNPELALPLSMLSVVPALADNPQFHLDFMGKAMDVWKGSTQHNTGYTNASPKTKEGLNTIFKGFLNVDPEDPVVNYRAQEHFDPLVNASNAIRYVLEDGDVSNDDQLTMVNLMDIIAQPNLAAWMGEERVSTESKDLLRRNFTVMQQDYLPKLVRDISEKVAAIPGAAIDIDSTGRFVISGDSPELRSIRKSGQLKALNSAVKGITHLAGQKEAANYRSTAEGFLSGIEEKVTEERADIQEKLSTELVNINKELGKLKKAKRQGPPVLKRRRELEEKAKQILEDITEQSGLTQSFTEDDNKVNGLRVAAFRKKHGSDVDVLTDEEILKGLA